MGGEGGSLTGRDASASDMGWYAGGQPSGEDDATRRRQQQEYAEVLRNQILEKARKKEAEHAMAHSDEGGREARYPGERRTRVRVLLSRGACLPACRVCSGWGGSADIQAPRAYLPAHGSPLTGHEQLTTSLRLTPTSLIHLH
jgi:hypothetical protein